MKIQNSAQERRKKTNNKEDAASSTADGRINIPHKRMRKLLQLGKESSGEDPGDEWKNYSRRRRIRAPCGTDTKTWMREEAAYTEFEES